MKDCQLILYFDGASRGNPGESGAGTAIKLEGEDNFMHEISTYLGKKTNNQAEYHALIQGLQRIISEIPKPDLCKNIRVLGDSQLIIRQINGQYKVRSKNIKHLYTKTVELISELKKSGCDLSFEHISREYNYTADRLANDAIDNN